MDVARACGLSVSQTSRALNGRQDVSEETKRRVSQTAAAMGYVKNLTAQTLSAKTPMQLAVVVTGVSEQTENSSFFFGIMQGVNSFANQNGYETVVYMMEKSPECFETYCRQRGAGGMILMNADYDEPAVKKVAEGNFPCVFIDIPYTGERKGCVIVNNAYYSRLAVEHMVKRGRKRIAMITGSGHSIVEKEREEGYMQALRQAGLTIKPEWIVKGDFRYDMAHEQAVRLMEKEPKIDGFFCASDLMALGVINALRGQHIKIPKQISVFGFDGLLSSEYARPKLSTIRQNQKYKGFLAARMLADILGNEAYEPTVVVPCEVCLRESV